MLYIYNRLHEIALKSGEFWVDEHDPGLQIETE